MNKKLLSKSHKKLAKSQKKLKEGLPQARQRPQGTDPGVGDRARHDRGLSGHGLVRPREARPARERCDRGQDKAVGLLTKGEPSEKREKREEEEKEEAEAHMPNGIVMEEKPGAV